VLGEWDLSFEPELPGLAVKHFGIEAPEAAGGSKPQIGGGGGVEHGTGVGGGRDTARNVHVTRSDVAC
jgi:hypothetical protein